jgi:hypothetical protein
MRKKETESDILREREGDRGRGRLINFRRVIERERESVCETDKFQERERERDFKRERF